MKKLLFFVFIFALVACEKDDYIPIDSETNQNQELFLKANTNPTGLDKQILKIH